MQGAEHHLDIVDGGTTLAAERVISALGAQTNRMLARLHLLDDAGWERPTRCPSWNVRQLVQHLVTTCERAALLLDADLGPTRSTFTAMDPRITPLQWMEADGHATPESLLLRYRAVTTELLARASALVDKGSQFSVDGPIGRVRWELFLLHGLWDSWVHERDAGLADRPPAHPDPRQLELELELVGTYALYIAVEAARLGGRRVSAEVRLHGPGGGTWIVTAADATAVRRLPAAARDRLAASELPVVTGPAIEAFEALSGRGGPPRSLLSGDTHVVSGLSALASFLTAGVDTTAGDGRGAGR